jgi:hypothetical protein
MWCYSKKVLQNNDILLQHYVAITTQNTSTWDAQNINVNEN